MHCVAVLHSSSDAYSFNEHKAKLCYWIMRICGTGISNSHCYNYCHISNEYPVFDGLKWNQLGKSENLNVTTESPSTSVFIRLALNLPLETFTKLPKYCKHGDDGAAPGSKFVSSLKQSISNNMAFFPPPTAHLLSRLHGSVADSLQWVSPVLAPPLGRSESLARWFNLCPCLFLLVGILYLPSSLTSLNSPPLSFLLQFSLLYILLRC